MTTDVLKTARRSGQTTLALGVLDVPVSLYKATAKPGKETRWETRLVDARGKPVEADPVRDVYGGVPAERLVLETQGDPLGGHEEDYNDRATQALDDAEDAERAWNPPPDPEPEPPEVRRQRGFETERGFVPAEEQLDAIEAASQLDQAKIVGFVRAEQVSRARTVGAYYLAPEGESLTEVATGRRALDMLLVALRRTSRFAVVKFTKKTVQGLGVIAPDRSGALVLLELAWGANLRKPPKAAILSTAAQYTYASPQEVDACVTFIEAMKEPRASLDALEDDAAVLRRQARQLAEENRLDEFLVPDRLATDAEVGDLIAAMSASAEVADDLVATG